jgi:hypothetical protein
LLVLFDSILIFSCYHIQYLLGKSNVLIIHITASAIQDFILHVNFPAKVFFQSIESYPEIWTNFVQRELDFFYSKYEIKPEMKQSDYDHASAVDARTINDMLDVSGELEDVADNCDWSRDMDSDISTHTTENQPTTFVQVHVSC